VGPSGGLLPLQAAALELGVDESLHIKGTGYFF